MSEHTSHCPICHTEFVAGVAACSDCGRPLLPGELPPRARNDDGPDAVRTTTASGAEITVEPPDTLLAEIPGEQAELIAKALALEGIPSLLVCDGVEQLRGPHEPPKPPIARKKTVEIYVPHTRMDDASEIADSMTNVDLIGDQWLDHAPEGSVEQTAAGRDDVISAATAMNADSAADETIAAQPIEPRPEGSRPSLLLFVLVTLIIAVFVYLTSL